MTFFDDKQLYGCGLTATCRHILTKGKKICEKEAYFTYKENFKEVNYGTFRNCVSYLIKQNLLDDYRSNSASYYVVGVRKPNANRESDHPMGVQGRMEDFLGLIERTKLEDRCIHDVQIWFRREGIYNYILGSEFVERIAPCSKDLFLKEVDFELYRIAKIRVHVKDSVSISLGCSQKPFPLSELGTIDFISTLGNLGGRIEAWCNWRVKVPFVGSWKIKGLHIGRDSKWEFSGEKFNFTVSEYKRTIRVYTKRINAKNKLRIEMIEEPDLDVASFIASRINGD